MILTEASIWSERRRRRSESIFSLKVRCSIFWSPSYQTVHYVRLGVKLIILVRDMFVKQLKLFGLSVHACLSRSIYVDPFPKPQFCLYVCAWFKIILTGRWGWVGKYATAVPTIAADFTHSHAPIACIRYTYIHTQLHPHERRNLPTQPDPQT